jgi:hypothetical protein
MLKITNMATRRKLKVMSNNFQLVEIMHTFSKSVTTQNFRNLQMFYNDTVAPTTEVRITVISVLFKAEIGT